MGDASNLVLILAGALLKRSETLLVLGIHPSEVILGYELACAKALEELESTYAALPTRNSLTHSPIELSISSLPKPLAKDSLVMALRPAIASKQYGSEDILAALVAEAALAVMPSNIAFFNIDNVRVVKIMGGSLQASRVVKGMVFGREPEGQAFSVNVTPPLISAPISRSREENFTGEGCSVYMRA